MKQVEKLSCQESVWSVRFSLKWQSALSKFSSRMNGISCHHVPYCFVVDDGEDFVLGVDDSEPTLVEAMLVVGDLCPLKPFDSGFKVELCYKISHKWKII